MKLPAQQPRVVYSNDEDPGARAQDGVSGQIISRAIVPRPQLASRGQLIPTMADSTLAEQYRLIRRPILDTARGDGRGKQRNVVLITSATDGEGKTFTAVNLAMSMCMGVDDNKVILVDADVRKKGLSNIFNVTDRPGLTEYLGGLKTNIAEGLIQTDVPGLAILPAGLHTQHAGELLASKRMRILMDGFSTAFPDRIVIVDSPSVLAGSAVASFIDYVGQTILVTQANAVSEHKLAEAIARIGEGKVSGLVVNQYRRNWDDVDTLSLDGE